MIGQKAARPRSPSPDHRVFKKQKSFTTAMRGLGLDGGHEQDDIDGTLHQKERLSCEASLQKSRVLECESFFGKLASHIHSGFEHIEHKVIDVMPCVRAQESVEEPTIVEESDIKIPCTGDHLHSIGVKFSTDVDKAVSGKKKHVITGVEEQHEFVKKTKLRVGDVLHAVNGLDLSTAEHRDVLDRFHHMDGQIIFILKRKKILEPDYDGEVDEHDGEVYTFIEIKIDILRDNGKVIFETVTLVESPNNDKCDDGPTLRYKDEFNVYIYPSKESSSFVAMTETGGLKVVPAKDDYNGGQWTMCRYKVLWPCSEHDKVKEDNTLLAVVLYNKTHKKCLAVSTGDNKSIVLEKQELASLKTLQRVDSTVFYRRLWENGTDRYVFESADRKNTSPHVYLAVGEEGITLIKQQDPKNFVHNTAFNLCLI